MRITAAILAFAAFSACGADALMEGLDVGERAPAIRGASWVGGGDRAPDLKNKVVLIDFWYAGCPTCVHTMPEVDQLAREYRKAGLVVVGPSLDSADAVRRFRDLHDVSYLFLAEATELARAFNVKSFPFLVLVGRDGRVLWRANFKDASLSSAIETALAR